MQLAQAQVMNRLRNCADEGDVKSQLPYSPFDRCTVRYRTVQHVYPDYCSQLEIVHIQRTNYNKCLTILYSATAPELAYVYCTWHAIRILNKLQSRAHGLASNTLKELRILSVNRT